MNRMKQERKVTRILCSKVCLWWSELALMHWHAFVYTLFHGEKRGSNGWLAACLQSKPTVFISRLSPMDWPIPCGVLFMHLVEEASCSLHFAVFTSFLWTTSLTWGLITLLNLMKYRASLDSVMLRFMRRKRNQSNSKCHVQPILQVQRS